MVEPLKASGTCGHLLGPRWAQTTTQAPHPRGRDHVGTAGPQKATRWRTAGRRRLERPGSFISAPSR